MGNPLEMIDRLPQVETLTPEILGKRLFETFEGYTWCHQPSVQLSFLLRHDLVYPTNDGYPVYTLTLPTEDEFIRPWKETHITSSSEYPKRTDRYTPDSPHIVPASLHNAPDVITVTNWHHYRKTLRGEHDIVISRKGPELTPFWYIKGEDPIKPQSMISLEAITSEPLWNRPKPQNIGATIQLWNFLPAHERRRSIPIGIDTYQLQAGVQLHKISLQDFLHVLGTTPDQLQQIEAAA